eukprot:TRINITY_DN1969_c0_g1_i3.p2 TRINITY_DN1969_c0_g1~~TRINITY_DN1969_c0_g1_i3.p2  ORF type:complete len:110 (-),score=6.34 TRINITY_DN1969_c0_g1_i3:101-430(-)
MALMRVIRWMIFVPNVEIRGTRDHFVVQIIPTKVLNIIVLNVKILGTKGHFVVLIIVIQVDIVCCTVPNATNLGNLGRFVAMPNMLSKFLFEQQQPNISRVFLKPRWCQ